MFRANFNYKMVDGVLVIYDENKGSMSVTNDMENVLADVQGQLGGLPEKIIYRDSEGIYDQTWLEENGNAQFRSLQDCRDEATAIHRVKEIKCQD